MVGVEDGVAVPAERLDHEADDGGVFVGHDNTRPFEGVPGGGKHVVLDPGDVRAWQAGKSCECPQ